MARLTLERKKKLKKFVALLSLWIEIINMIDWFIQLVGIVVIRSRMRQVRPTYTIMSNERVDFLQRLVYLSDETCLEQLRMNRAAFVKLCTMLQTKGNLKESKYLQIHEQVAIFLHVLAHHAKNRVVKFMFRRSGETVSKYFNIVLNAVLRLEGELFQTPEPIPENSTDERWKYFKVYQHAYKSFIECYSLLWTSLANFSNIFHILHFRDV